MRTEKIAARSNMLLPLISAALLVQAFRFIMCYIHIYILPIFVHEFKKPGHRTLASTILLNVTVNLAQDSKDRSSKYFAYRIRYGKCTNISIPTLVPCL